MRNDLNQERKDMFNKIWTRYHDELIGLPSQVYLDMGYLMGWVMDADHACWPDGVEPLPVVDDSKLKEQRAYIRWMDGTINVLHQVIIQLQDEESRLWASARANGKEFKL